MTLGKVWMNYVFHILIVLCVVRATLSVSPDIDRPNDCEEDAVNVDIDDCASYYRCLDGVVLKQRCPEESYFNSTYEVCIIDVNGMCSSAAGKCSEGDTQTDPKDCAGYLKCVNGGFVELKCKNSSYYDSAMQVCLIDENGVCSSKPEICSDGDLQENPDDCAGYLECINGILVDFKCDIGSYFNYALQICIIDENAVCTPNSEICSEGDLKENPKYCAGYLKCVNGSFVELKCKNGSYYDSTMQVCLVDENGVCSSTPEICLEGDLQENPEDCAGYLECINGILVDFKCDHASYFNTTLSICIVDENGVCTPNSEICSEGQLQEDPEDCAGYLKCVNGSLVELKCKNGSYYDSTMQICLVDENGDCSSTPEICSDGDLRENPDDCAGYLECINGIMVDFKCDNGSYFNTTLSICIVDENGVCTPNSEICSEGELQEDTNSCGSYLKCVNKILVEMKCERGTYFNTNLKACIIDENRVCIP